MSPPSGPGAGARWRGDGALDPAASVLDPVVERLRGGGVVAVPTDTVYGLAVDPRRAGAAEALFALKGRPDRLALPVLVAGTAEALELTAGHEAAALLARLAAAFWPGRLTIVVPLAPAAGLRLGGDGATVGLRCPGAELLLRLLARSGPLAVTSANRHGEPPCTTAAEVRAVFGGELAASEGGVLDGGTCNGTPSSVVSLVGGEAELLRAGPVGLDEVRDVLRADPAAVAHRAAGAAGGSISS